MYTLKTAFILSFILCGFKTFAQQDALSSQFWNNYVHINPAVSGLFYKHQAAASYRNQWDKVNGAPNTINANYSMKLDKLHGGLGIAYEHDAIGFARQHNAMLNYSYHLKLGEKSTLAAGISAGILNMKFSGTWIPPTNVPDASLPSGGGSAFDMNAGLVFKTDKLTVGLSSTHITQSEVKTVNYSPARHYILFADYTFNLGSDFFLKPQLITRTDAVKFSGDINVLAYYKNTYWLGMTYRTSDAIAFMAGWDIKEKFRVGYSYDYTINQLSSVSRGTHEIVLGFMMKYAGFDSAQPALGSAATSTEPSRSRRSFFQSLCKTWLRQLSVVEVRVAFLLTLQDLAEPTERSRSKRGFFKFDEITSISNLSTCKSLQKRNTTMENR